MPPKIWFWISLIAGATTMNSVETARAINLPSDNEIRVLLSERIKALGAERGGVGIVVGVIGPKVGGSFRRVSAV